MQAAAHELEVPVRWGGCWRSLFTIASPEDSVADYVAACRATGQKPFLDGPHFELSRACRHNRPDQDRPGQGVADPFNGYIDQFRISHVQRSDGWIETTWNNMSDAGAFAVQGPRSRKAASRHPLQALVWSSA